MATLTEIHRNSDETISFQLFDSDGNLIDVDDILDIDVDLIQKFSLVTISSYVMADLDLDSATDTIYIYMPGSDTAGEQTGVYKLHVEWSITNLDFPDGTEDSVDEIDIFVLLA